MPNQALKKMSNGTRAHIPNLEK